MMDDAALLRAYAENRSERAFAEFVGRRIGFVYVAALRQVGGDAHLAEDVTLGVFGLVAKRAGALAGHERLAGWLYTTTRNTAHQAWRDARRRDAREQEAARMSELHRDDAAGAAGSDEFVGAGKLRLMLDEALGALRAGEREAVLLRFFEGRGFWEIGGRLKMSEDAARMRVARALEKMRGSLARRGVTSSAGALSTLMTAEAALGAPAGLAASVSAGAVASAGVAAAGAGAGVGAILAFMSSAKITMVAVVAFLIAAGGAYFGAQNERASSDALAEARRENSRLAAQLRGLEKQAAAAKPDPVAAGRALLADHPEIKEKLVALDRAVAKRFSYRIAKALDLSPEQSEKLSEIWGRGSVGLSTYATRNYGTVSFAGLRLREESEVGSLTLKELLGDAGFEKFLHFMGLRNVGSDFSAELGNALCFTDEPLTSQQAWGLEEIARDLEKNHADITDAGARWDAMVERARSVLSPRQMRALVEIGDRYVWQRELTKWNSEYNAAAANAQAQAK